MFENIFEPDSYLSEFESIFGEDNGEQRGNLWFEQRKGRATGSCFHLIMTKGKGDKPSATRKSYAIKVASERLTGGTPRSIDTPAMAWGREMEAEAIRLFQEKYGVVVDSCGFIPSDDGLMYGTSPDGLIGDDGCIEVKCRNSDNHATIMLEGVCPKEHFAQVQGHMMVTNRKYCWFISYDPRFSDENLRLWCVKVPRDEEYIDNLRSEVLKFLDEVDEIVSKLKGER